MVLSVLTPREWAMVHLLVGVLAFPVMFAKVFAVRALDRHMAALMPKEALAKFKREYATVVLLCLGVAVILNVAGLVAGYRAEGGGEDAPVFFAMALSVAMVDVAWQGWIYRKAFRDAGDAKYVPWLILHLATELALVFVLSYGLLFFWSNVQYLLS